MRSSAIWPLLLVLCVIGGGFVLRHLRLSRVRETRVAAAERVRRVGTVWQSLPTTKRLVLTNRGATSVTIEKMRASCFCAVFSPDGSVSIPAGGRTRFDAVFTVPPPERLLGEALFRVQIVPVRRGTAGSRGWTLAGRSRPAFRDQPDLPLQLAVGDFPVQSSWVLALHPSLELVSVAADAPDLSVKFDGDGGANAEKSQYRVWARHILVDSAAPLAQSWNLRLDVRDSNSLEELPPIVLPVRWSPLVVLPDKLTVKEMRIGASESLTVALQPRHGVIERVELEVAGESTRSLGSRIEHDGARAEVRVAQVIARQGSHGTRFDIRVTMRDNRGSRFTVIRTIPISYYGRSEPGARLESGSRGND